MEIETQASFSLQIPHSVMTKRLNQLISERSSSSRIFSFFLSFFFFSISFLLSIRKRTLKSLSVVSYGALNHRCDCRMLILITDLTNTKAKPKFMAQDALRSLASKDNFGT